MANDIQIKRIYDEVNEADGFRVLVDRLWPRGITKLAARIDLWAKELTPSNSLRQWFHESSDRLEEFSIRYQGELAQQQPTIEQILLKLEQSAITLVTATKDLEFGHSAVLKRFLVSHVSK